MARPRSLRWWLGVLVTATALPTLALLGAIYAMQVQRAQQQSRATALRVAQATAARLLDFHRRSVSLLQALAERPQVRNFDGRTCDSLFGVVDLFPEYANVYFYDPSLRLACAASPDAETAALVDAARPRLEETLRGGALRPHEATVLLVRPRLVSAVCEPVRDAGGRFRGTLVLLEVPQLFTPNELPPDSVVTVVDPNGTVIGRSQASPAWSGRNMRDAAIVSVALRQKNGIAEAIGIDGVARQYGFATVPDTRWIVYAGVPTSVVTQRMRPLFLRGVVAAFGILAFVSGVGVLLVRRIERPVQQLAAAARLVARGEYVKLERPEGPIEILTLGEAFNEMVERRLLAEEQLRQGQRELHALSERLLAVQEEERRRIAHELHDDLGQSLTALKMDITGLLASPPPNRASSPLVQRIVETLDLTVTAVQRISAELRPGVLEDLGLLAALESEATRFEERTGIECELSLPSETQIEPKLANVIFRIVQEALTNVARHANATRVELRLRERPGEVLLEVRDDGRGIAVDEIGSADSLGIIGMRERAHGVGGTIRVEGVADRGTIVSLRVPAAAAASARK